MTWIVCDVASSAEKKLKAIGVRGLRCLPLQAAARRGRLTFTTDPGNGPRADLIHEAAPNAKIQ
jgi:hypothetical protein